MFSVDAVAAQLVALGVRRGGVLLVHTSFRAVRPVEGGPLGLVEGLRRALGPDGTLVMPTMTDGERVFDPRTTPTVGMGAVAETFWRQPGVLRSTHPGGSFAAEGPHAEVICAPQPLEPPHGPDSPPGRVLTLGGQVLLLGVEHSESTMLHVAESLANVPYSIGVPTVVAPGVTAIIHETDHCCANFDKVEGWLAIAKSNVGNARAKLADARALVDAACARLTEDPLVFLCPSGAACDACDVARASIDSKGERVGVPRATRPITK